MNSFGESSPTDLFLSDFNQIIADIDDFNDNNIDCNRSQNQLQDESLINRFNNIHLNHVISDEEFKVPESRFVHELEALEKKTLTSDNESLTRMSVLRRFDPLNDTIDSNNESMVKTNNVTINESRSRLEIINQSLNSNISHIISNQSYEERPQNESTTLMNFNSPLIVANHNSRVDSCLPRNANEKDLLVENEEQMSDKFNDFQTRELILHEKLIEKDRHLHLMDERLNAVQTNCERYEFMLNLLHNLNEQIVEMASEMIDNLSADKNELIEKCNEMSAERTQALEEVNNVEKNFYEIHNRYDKVRTALEESKQREIQFNEEYMELMDKLKEKDQMYDLLKAKAEQKIEDANNYIESARRECESDLIATKAQLKRSDMKINGLQAQLDQKTKENDELTKMVDELIANVEK